MALSTKQLRSWARRVVPEQARPRAKAVALGVLRPFLAGSAVQCPVCRRSFRHLVNVGGARSPRFQCPGCGAHDRHRLLALYLDEHDAGGRVLHFAPEPMIARRFEERPGVAYVTGDLGARATDVQLDITALPIRDRSFDLVLCSHVLEHVPDDAAALAEVRRVVATTGVALLQVPVKEPGRTVEIGELASEADRRAMAGDHGHVRSYGRDFADRARAAGLAVTVVTAATMGEGVSDRHAVDPSEELFVCRVP